MALLKNPSSNFILEPSVPSILEFRVRAKLNSECIESALYPPGVSEVYYSPLRKLAIGPERVVIASGDSE